MRSIPSAAARAALVTTCLTLLVTAPAGAAASAAAAAEAAATARAAGDTARVRIGSAESGTDMFVAWPAGREAAQGVIVVQEWWGLDEQIREVAKRFAKQGYVAVVPDLYHGKVAADAEGAHTLSRGLEDADALVDLKAAIAWLRQEPRVGKERIGVVGYCMGGRLSQLLALESADIAAAVMYYGRPITDAKSVGKLKAPLQGHFGADDQGIPVARVKELQSALAKAGKQAEVFVYPGAGHAFMNEMRASHSPDAARQAWARTLAFLQRHLKGTR